MYEAQGHPSRIQFKPGDEVIGSWFKHSLLGRILVFKRQHTSYFYLLKIFHFVSFPNELKVQGSENYRDQNLPFQKFQREKQTAKQSVFLPVQIKYARAVEQKVWNEAENSKEIDKAWRKSLTRDVGFKRRQQAKQSIVKRSNMQQFGRYVCTCIMKHGCL